MLSLFLPYLDRWDLAVDGEPIVTHSSRLLPVRYPGGGRSAAAAAAMLKIAVEPEERYGGGLMVWWDGQGAARVLARDDENGVLLLERARGKKSLAEMARGVGDDDATHILCATVARLHVPRDRPPLPVVPLTAWFRDLFPAADRYGGLLKRSAAMARSLLAGPRETVVLHGDIHHGNVLDFGPERGWLAIDPKRLGGERYFDYANIFCNPDHETAAAPGRLARRASVVAETAGLDRQRLLEWIVAWAGLSAAWSLGDGTPAPETSLGIAEIAAAELGR